MDLWAGGVYRPGARLSTAPVRLYNGATRRYGDLLRRDSHHCPPSARPHGGAGLAGCGETTHAVAKAPIQASTICWNGQQLACIFEGSTAEAAASLDPPPPLNQVHLAGRATP